MLVLDRILAIPERDRDFVQMGLTTREWAILKKTGKTKDGKAANPSVLKQDRSKTLIKGDKKLSEVSESPKPVFRELDSSIAKKVKGAIAGVKGGKVVKGKSPRDRGFSPTKAVPRKSELEFKAGDLSTIKNGFERAKIGSPKKIKSSKLTSRNKAVSLLYPPNEKSKQNDSFRNYSTDQIKKLAKRYPDIGWENKKTFDYNPDKASIGDTLEYIRPTFEQKEKGLVSQFLKVSSVKNGKVYGTPVDKTGRNLSDKQIPIIATPTASNLPKGNRYRRLIDVKSDRQSKPITKPPSATAKKLNLTAAKEAEILKSIKRF